MSKTEDKKPEVKSSGMNLNRFKYGTTFTTGGHLQPSSGHVHGSGCGCGPADDADEDMD
jgi:hypothetical protein